MGFLKKAIIGRWFTRWLLRGGPWGVAAKLSGVALWGIWKWRKEKREAERTRRAQEIPAEYEVMKSEADDAAAAPAPRPIPREPRPE